MDSVARLIAVGETAYFALQNVAEFWNVVTRPVVNNGLGFSIALAQGEVEAIERILTLLPDTPVAYVEWKRLVAKHGVMGAKVHDARLVALMNVHGVERVLTFDTGDFARFGVETSRPSATVS